MLYFVITFHLLFVIDLVQSFNKTNVSFVDIRSVYYYNPEAANRSQAIAICKNISAWLVTFDHEKEYKAVTTFYRSLPTPRSGDDVRIQVCATLNSSALAQQWFYQWNYYFKPSKIFSIFPPRWCIVHDKLNYPLNLPNFTCLMVSMDKEKNWCYKNYDCNNYLPFICERKLTWPANDILLNVIKEYSVKGREFIAMNQDPNDCNENKYVRIGSSYYVGGKPDKLNLTAAEKQCKTYDSHLLYMENYEEQRALANFLKNCGADYGVQFWTAGNKGETADWFWTDQDALSHAQFCKDEPNRNPGYEYLTIYLEAGSVCLKTAVQEAAYAYICERDE